jgi:Sec-independent protein translocase protein TatA
MRRRIAIPGLFTPELACIIPRRRKGGFMFGIGLSELLVIAVLFLIIVNPKEIPGIFRKIGKTYQGMRKMREEFLRNLEEGDREATPSSHTGGNTREPEQPSR